LQAQQEINEKFQSLELSSNDNKFKLDNLGKQLQILEQSRIINSMSTQAQSGATQNYGAEAQGGPS